MSQHTTPSNTDRPFVIYVSCNSDSDSDSESKGLTFRVDPHFFDPKAEDTDAAVGAEATGVASTCNTVPAVLQDNTTSGSAHSMSASGATTQDTVTEGSAKEGATLGTLREASSRTGPADTYWTLKRGHDERIAASGAAEAASPDRLQAEHEARTAAMQGTVEAIFTRLMDGAKPEWYLVSEIATQEIEGQKFFFDLSWNSEAKSHLGDRENGYVDDKTIFGTNVGIHHEHPERIKALSTRHAIKRKTPQLNSNGDSSTSQVQTEEAYRAQCHLWWAAGRADPQSSTTGEGYEGRRWANFRSDSAETMDADWWYRKCSERYIARDGNA